jgi:hypothetical protein
MEAVATTGAHGLSIDNKSLQGMLKDEVKIAFDNATGNEIFARKYKVKKSAEGRVGCIVKGCQTTANKGMEGLQSHCLRAHKISFSSKDEFILNIELKDSKIDALDMNSEDAWSIKNLPESVSISNDRIKETGIVGESNFSTADNDLQYRLKDEIVRAFENYKDDNNYGSQYKLPIVDNSYECIMKGCELSYERTGSLNNHCRKDHSIRITFRKKYAVAIEKIQDNTNATNTTTNNMDSTRKRSHSPATHEEESNAKKAMFNPSESGYPQSAPASENIDDKELLELARELAENNSDFQYSLEKDVADKYATSRDSYLQFSITPKKVYDENVTFSSWGDDYMNDTLAGN